MNLHAKFTLENTLYFFSYSLKKRIYEISGDFDNPSSILTKYNQTQSNTNKKQQTKWPNNKMFGHQTMFRVLMEWGAGPHVGCRLNCSTFVGKYQLIFLSLVGNFSFALSVVSNIV